MKKIILLLVLIFCSMFGYSQTASPNDYIPWQLSNQGCYGCASFYWKVTKTGTQYDVWFTSNSFYQNGVYASTYLWGIKLFVDNVQINQPMWLLFKECYTNKLLTFSSANPQPTVILMWEGIKVY